MPESETNVQISDAILAKRTARGSAFYNDVFGYSEESLNGLNILDIGAGDSDFSKTVENAGGQLIRLDAQYSVRPPKPHIPGAAIAGLVQCLPFKDRSFDETIASFSLYWIKAGLAETLKDMIRVTKDEGMIKVCPVFPVRGSVFDPAVSFNSTDYVFEAMSVRKNPSYSPSDWENVVRGIIIGMKFNYDSTNKTSFSQEYNHGGFTDGRILLKPNSNKPPFLKDITYSNKNLI